MKKYNVILWIGLLFSNFSYGITPEKAQEIQAYFTNLYKNEFEPEALKVYQCLKEYGKELRKNAPGYTLLRCAQNTRAACKNFVSFLRTHQELCDIAIVYFGVPLNKESGVTTLHMLAGFAEINDFKWCMEIADRASKSIPTKFFPDINEVRTVVGRYAIHYAAGYNHDKAMIEYLSSINVSMNVQDNKLLTPLHVAYAFNNNDQVIAALIEAGASTMARDNTGKLPHDYRKNN